MGNLSNFIALLIVCFKIAGRKVIGHDVVFDVLITGALMLTLAGTYSGMMAALFGGLFVSVFLMILRKTTYRDQIQIVRPYKKGELPEVRVVRVYPK